LLKRGWRRPGAPLLKRGWRIRGQSGANGPRDPVVHTTQHTPHTAHSTKQVGSMSGNMKSWMSNPHLAGVSQQRCGDCRRILHDGTCVACVDSPRDGTPRHHRIDLGPLLATLHLLDLWRWSKRAGAGESGSGRERERERERERAGAGESGREGMPEASERAAERGGCGSE
jgi:hypothetical protein